jgi:hypothetical protein
MLIYLSYNLLLRIPVHWCDANYVIRSTPNINELLPLRFLNIHHWKTFRNKLYRTQRVLCIMACTNLFYDQLFFEMKVGVEIYVNYWYFA